MKPYYTDSAVTIFHGDCLEVMASLPMVDHVITDPPYSDHTHAKQWIGHALTAEGGPRTSTAHKGLGFDALTEEVRHGLSWAAARHAARWTLVFTDLEGLGAWRESLIATGLEYVRGAVWDKVDGAPQFTGDRPAAGAEAIICAHPKGRKRWNGGGQRGVFRHAVNGDRGAKPHPSTKPLPLMLELVSLFTDPGEVILDPFMGSGTTLRACKDLGRRAIGIEINEKYCEVAAKRMEQEVLFTAPKAEPEQMEIS